MEIVAIVLSLGLLIFLAYRGITLLILAPACALVAVILSGHLPLLAHYTQVFMPATGMFIVQFFPLFLLGAIFGKTMEDSGLANSLAHWISQQLGPKNAILSIVLACAALTYGGVSLFVVAFAVFPIAASLFKETNTPKRLIPGTIALGAFTFTMTALPGTPAIQNAIPMPYFNTTPFAAPGLGIVAAAIMLTIGLAWLYLRARIAVQKNEGYENNALKDINLKQMREHAHSEGFDVIEIGHPAVRDMAQPWQAALPIILVIVLNYLFSKWWLPNMDSSYLASAKYGSTHIDALKGVWSIILSLTISIGFIILMNLDKFKNLKQSLDSGANASVLPIFNTAALVGFGAVIASLGGFVIIKESILGVAPNNPLISLSISVNVLAGITGSASGGMSIALQTLGDTYMRLAEETGIPPELLHRITAVATGGLDALPHNGAVITLLSICSLTHKQSYLDILIVAVFGPLVALISIITLAHFFGTF